MLYIFCYIIIIPNGRDRKIGLVMGLDMYLYARGYESDFTNETLKYPKELKELEEDIKERNFKSVSTKYQVGYWRKFNSLHNWFVDKCANGEDDCQDIYVEFNELDELYDICKKVLDDHSLAPKLLPTTKGFFFGSQDYDEYYFDDWKYTIELIEKVKKIDTRKFDIIYQASW